MSIHYIGLIGTGHTVDLFALKVGVLVLKHSILLVSYVPCYAVYHPWELT